MVEFIDIISRSSNPIAVSMLLIVSWIAVADGKITDEEMAGLRSITASSKLQDDLNRTIDIAMRCRVVDLQIACQQLTKLNVLRRDLFLELSISMALEDGVLTTGEGHIIRLIADALSCKPAKLNYLFRKLTGNPFPIPSDLSNVDWWKSRENQYTKQDRNDQYFNQPHDNARPPRQTLQYLRDLAILGLGEDASFQQIKDAYRRMVAIHHPDKFTPLGPEAVKAADISFQRIQSAYERLMGP